MTETSSTTPGTPYGATKPGGPPQPSGGAAFFDWVRSLGFVRGRDRWLAGVCGAVAARTGLDPMIVRGIAVVIAILGGPIFFLYAVGWALMPDESGRSLVEKAVQQVFEPAMIAVGALVFLTFIPWMQGIWWQGPPEVWGMPGWLEVLLRTSWAIGLTVAIIVLVIYIIKRVPSPRNQPATGYGAGASQPGAAEYSAAQYSAAQYSAPQSGAASEPTTTATPTASFVPPIPPVPDAPAAPAASPSAAPSGPSPSGPSPTGQSLWDDLTGKTTPARTVPYGSAPYGSTTPTGSSAPSGSDPRPAAPASTWDPHRYSAMHRRKQLGAGFISVVAGLALSVGAVAASFVADGAWSTSAFLVGGAAALAVIALGIVVAGIRGKEGGWLNFFSILLAAAMLWTVVIPAGTDVATFGDPTWQYTSSAPTGFAMIAGAPVIDLTGIDSAPSGDDHTVDVWTAFGEVELLLPENRTVVVVASSLAGGVDYSSLDAAGAGAGEGDLEYGGVFFHDSRLVADGRGTGVTTVRVWTLFGVTSVAEPAAR